MLPSQHGVLGQGLVIATERPAFYRPMAQLRLAHVPVRTQVFCTHGWCALSPLVAPPSEALGFPIRLLVFPHASLGPLTATLSRSGRGAMCVLLKW